ncbi:MAG TPA: PAS domain-containing protein [Actinomycetota bacterium]|nr:PAS domain-containing protein [Actinomycetota bacterium]
MGDVFEPADFGIGSLFYAIRDAVIVANAKTERIVLWNQQAVNLFRYEEREALLLPLHALVPENLRDAHRKGLARFQEMGSGPLIDSGMPVELTGMRKDQRKVAIELTLTPVDQVDSEGSRFVLAIVRDISERKAGEEARLELREVELRQRQAAELHNKVVQGLTVAKLALEMGENARSAEAMSETLDSARRIVDSLLSAAEERQSGIDA